MSNKQVKVRKPTFVNTGLPIIVAGTALILTLLMLANLMLR